ncbi:VOC family protein [Chitinophaga sp. GCM10012297]|uniref:VOC family protein n=1 Tax=Chitinophaga chungangae TaxID=2821488 RepID=A0ABS3YI88_9BACT|nr:VOC family protein [Chitinophaga chungangae]MBO9153804.1 VOC family protein [Chitinophaga chungangae]
MKQFWINLPVKDVKRSKEFFGKLGFQFNPQYGDQPNSASLLLGDKGVVVMLFDEPTFKGFTNTEVADRKQTEVLLSIDAQSKEEVDEMAKKAVEAGGASSHKPSQMQGWMYGCVFSDPDGHRWNVLYMDMSKMPK